MGILFTVCYINRQITALITNDNKNRQKMGLLRIGHLICTLISENQDLDELRSVSNLRKISVPAHLIFFSVYQLVFFSDLYHKPEKNP